MIAGVKRPGFFVVLVNRHQSVKQQAHRLTDAIHRTSAYSTKQKVHRR